MKNVIVIGGGAAGMMAALAAAKNGHQVTLVEKNEKLGKKIYITGKGRCNVTNDCDTEDFFKQVLRNPKFLYSAVYTYDTYRVQQFFEEHGCPLKVERGGRVFPVSDHSSDIIRTLEKELRNTGVKISLFTKVTEILTQDNRISSVKVIKDRREDLLPADAVVLCTGGCSYPSTGSTGDGYKFAEAFGHEIKTPTPSLVPFITKESFVKDLMGLSLKNVEATICDSKGKKLYSDFGEMLFTHFGVSGPLMLSASAKVNDQIGKENLYLTIDLKPALSKEQLDKRILRDFEENPNRQFKNAVTGLFPGKLTPVMIALSGIDPERKVNEITRAMREEFCNLIKAMPLTLTGVRGFEEAIVTRGGISVKQINPSTMESKLISGLYFAGEVLDLDAYTGGYNLQIAWSTGYLAGSSIE
ncbi:MAG: NAD(P)/FAD-dependent oxidoreductase [Lachnospiraceae bacterium]|jgi:hypothetical protein|nr:NAD(P)/FAD-dependent oxidoreductase [Lachnospiraceae bacterium]